MTEDDPGFDRFVEDWNREQQQDTPAHHGRIVEWLSGSLTKGERNLLLMAFRGAGKSTIVGLFAAWLLLGDPNRRLMVVAADQRLARKMVRNVRRIIEAHPGTQGLRPERPDQWSSDEFTVNRPRELRDPSMLARGIAGNFTGSRADVVICDDVEVPRTCDTAPKREDLRQKLAEIDYVLVPGGTQLYVGTPHSYYTIYAEEARGEVGEVEPFLSGYERLVLPVWDDDGVPAWPDRYDRAHIEKIRRRSGPAKFATQMLLKPVSLSAGRLDPDRLRPYEGEPVYREAQGRATLALNGVRLVSVTCWWDPAFARADDDGRSRGDASVVAVVFGDEEGNRRLHRVLYLATDPQDPAPEAVQQCRAVAALARTLHLPAVQVETNGIGTFLPNLLRNELKTQGLAVAVVGRSSTRPKALRIVEAFDALLAGGRLHAHRGVWDTPFVREMREWRPGGRSAVRDDGLDAVAGALSGEPDRFDSPPPPSRGPDWRGGTVVAPADFDV